MRRELLAVSAALMLAVSGAGVAAAQPLPGLSATDYAHDPVVQLMLAGEANSVAAYLGIPADQLQGELAGHSLADVTRQHGKSVAEVTDVVVQTANQQLDAAVTSGQLSADTAGQY